MDCDVIDVTPRQTNRPKRALTPCAWKSVISVPCLVFPFSLPWPTLLTCSSRASVTTTQLSNAYVMQMYYMFHQLSQIWSIWQGHDVLSETSFTLNFVFIVNGEMTYIQNSFAMQLKQHYIVY